MHRSNPSARVGAQHAAPLHWYAAPLHWPPRTGGRGAPRFAALLLSLLAARPAPAQAIGQGFELERAGQHQLAVTVYFATVRADPTNLPALLGLERVLPLLGRLPELLPVAQRAAALRWAADAPGDEAPWREWAIALEDAHRHDAALEVLLAGRRAVARPPAFGVELADLLQRSGEGDAGARRARFHGPARRTGARAADAGRCADRRRPARRGRPAARF